ncbi:uncharacterized protein GGS22DRAFT_19262 [Annulohypoxylon maeteangense]|uniref:uncharacterized protein n=1 Tax=Annulohypoxylon maeteangense TaxID=1927788 RepID=UPI0020087D62|nr:uncharacterized protein GGS22DRAFT_19262 [Annulohypoxylon maeteangense]KAI0884114.1 hypothetical protein GGS22DRAFT_19262 [Annulohypoxylon maeteangense]
MMDSERLKSLEDAEEELRRRRERGKLAQRAFRKRQSNKVSKDKRNEAEATRRLKAAIDGIIKVAHSDDRPELLRAIQEAAEVAGSDVWRSSEVLNSRDEDGTATTGPSYPPNTENYVPKSGIHPARTTSAALGSMHHESWADLRLNNLKSSLFGTELDLEPVSPRLDYGLWFDAGRFLRIDDPPLDIVPYLGKGMKTFAGRLFWNCGEYLLDLCRRVEAYNKTNPLIAREAHQRIWNMVQHSPPLHNIHYIIALAEARREFRDRGYIEGNNPAGEVDSAEILNEHVLADYEKRGDDATIWLSPGGVETKLRGLMSDELYRRLEHVLENCDLSLAGDPLTEMIQSIIHTMSRSYICFGDGPRWRADRVAAIFNGNARSELA